MMWGALLLVGAARAQEIPPVPALDAELYRFPVDAQATLWADDAGSPEALALYGTLGISYLRDAYNFEWQDGETQSALAAGAQLSAVVGVAWRRLRLGLDVPVSAAPQGDLGDLTGGLGDLAVDLKGTLLRREAAPLGLALSVRASAPTGTAQAPVVSDGATADLALIADRRWGPLLVAANAGATLRPEKDLGAATWGPAALARLGVGYDLSPRVTVSADLASQLGLSGVADPGASPVELLGGTTLRGKQLVTRLGAGTGLTRGVGSPSMRLIASVGYAPQRSAPPEPAPVQVEAVPPPPGRLEVLVLGPDDGPLPASVTFGYSAPQDGDPAGAIALSEAGAGGVALARAGGVRVAAALEGYTATSAEVEVVLGEVRTVTLRMAPIPQAPRAVRPDLAERIQFEYDTANLTPDARAALREVAAFLQAHTELLLVRIDGYASAEGAADYNLALSQRRAQAVVDFLVGQGVAAGRLTARGLGEVGQEGTETVLAPNRKVELSALRWTEAAPPQ